MEMTLVQIKSNGSSLLCRDCPLGLTSTLGHVYVTPLSLPSLSRASKSAPGTFPVLGTAAPAWGTLLLLDPIGRCPVALGNFQMTLFL